MCYVSSGPWYLHTHYWPVTTSILITHYYLLFSQFHIHHGQLYLFWYPSWRRGIVIILPTLLLRHSLTHSTRDNNFTCAGTVIRGANLSLCMQIVYLCRLSSDAMQFYTFYSLSAVVFPIQRSDHFPILLSSISLTNCGPFTRPHPRCVPSDATTRWVPNNKTRTFFFFQCIGVCVREFVKL